MATLAGEGDRNYKYLSMDAISDTDKVALVERHLLSEALVMKTEPAGAMLSEDEVVSILFNETM